MAALVTFLVAVSVSSRAATPPPGFEDRLLVDSSAATGAETPVAIAYEPGSGALFVLEKGEGNGSGHARVRRRDPLSGLVTTALTLDCVDSTGERGLLGIATDPDYLDEGGGSRWVYLYYTRNVEDSGECAISGVAEGEYNWIVRFQESAGVLSSEERILMGPRQVTEAHHGGTLRFLSDKTLLASMGDDASGVTFARNLNDLRGKLIRINRDGSIPPDNPFVGQIGTRPEVWAWGLRNPFRFSVDSPPSDDVWIGDVGEHAWEELNRGIPGADYGWPCYEGAEAFQTCHPAPGEGSVTFPEYAYSHSDQSPPVEGNSVTMGPVYRGSTFPQVYQGRLFFGDYVRGWIRCAEIGPGGTLAASEIFAEDASGVVDMAVSPEGCLTWVSVVGEGVRSICYIAGTNGQPQAVATAAPVSGLAPLDVQFDGTTSSDPDLDPLVFAWTFGDGTSSTEPAPVKTYVTDGVYEATLEVDDGRGAANSTTTAPPLRIVVGNREPQGTITEPPLGAHFSAGDVISFAGMAVDPEDGVLPASAFSWMVVFHHDVHTHPFLGPITGVSSGEFTVPFVHEESTDVFYRISLTVTDSGAPLGTNGQLSHTSFIDVLPNVTTITVATDPPDVGLELAIDHVPGAAPWSISSVVSFPRTITAPSPQVVNGATWTFVSWSDGGAAEHGIAAPVSPTTYTATFACTAGCDDVDGDADGFTPAQGDCDDGDAASYPGAPEACDGNDNGCTGSIPRDEHDPDADGIVVCTGWNDTQADNPDIIAGGDNCPLLPNPEQSDSDGDGVGDACETRVRGGWVSPS